MRVCLSDAGHGSARTPRKWAHVCARELALTHARTNTHAARDTCTHATFVPTVGELLAEGEW